MVPSDVPRTETPQQALERLRAEVEGLRASRERLARATDADRRQLERELHDGPQQQLVALAVNLELARRLADSDPAAAKRLLDEMGDEVRHALEETGRLAHRIYPPLLEAGGLAAALRTAAADAGVRVRLEIAAVADCPPEIAGAIYFCCLDVLEGASEGAQLAVGVREEDGAVVFDVVDESRRFGEADAPDRDRIEALGGRLEARPTSARGVQMSGSLPLSR